MLAVVIGSLDLLGRRLGHGDTRSPKYVEVASEGTKRAALLTQRLLTFLRQQPLKPERTDSNKLVSGMSDLLRTPPLAAVLPLRWRTGLKRALKSMLRSGFCGSDLGFWRAGAAAAVEPLATIADPGRGVCPRRVCGAGRPAARRLDGIDLHMASQASAQRGGIRYTDRGREVRRGGGRR